MSNYTVKNILINNTFNMIEKIKLLKKASLYPETREEALSSLLRVYLKNKNFKALRELLKENIGTFNNKSYSYLLDFYEMNFNSCLKINASNFNYDTLQRNAFKHLIFLNENFGLFREAENMLKTLLLSDNPSIQTIFMLAELYMRTHRFYECLDLLNRVQGSTDYENYWLERRKFHARYFLGQVNMKEYLEHKEQKEYSYSQLCEENDKTLLEHLSKHVEKNKNNGFFKDTNLGSLLEETKSLIEDINPVYTSRSDTYIFRFDRPIGYFNEEETTDVCVVTHIGTKKPITMYPIRLSDEFNKEGNLESKKLKLQRIQGGMKR